MNEMKITSFADLQRYALGEIVELPAFGEGMPFVARLKRPSLADMVIDGRFPNALLSSATGLFSGSTAKADEVSGDKVSSFYSVLVEVAKAALVEPTYDEILKANMSLSQEQLMALWEYTQNGVKKLDNFRQK